MTTPRHRVVLNSPGDDCSICPTCLDPIKDATEDREGQEAIYCEGTCDGFRGVTNSPKRRTDFEGFHGFRPRFHNLRLTRLVKPYKTRSKLLNSVYKASANREAIQNQERP